MIAQAAQFRVRSSGLGYERGRVYGGCTWRDGRHRGEMGTAVADATELSAGP